MKFRTLGIATALLMVGAVALALSFGRLPEEAVAVTATVTVTEMATQASTSTPTPTPTASAPEPVDGLQATFYNVRTDKTVGTANQHEPRAALSIAKIYMADYVLAHGTEDEGYQALQMLSDSSDTIADQLFRKYPQSIDTVAREHRLQATSGQGYWGYSTTSTHDMVTFLKDLYDADPHHPILVAMSLAAAEAADGYEQDFGTATLPGAVATKWGWSNDRRSHASATVGEGWIAAATAWVDAEGLSDLAKTQLQDLAREAAS